MQADFAHADIGRAPRHTQPIAKLAGHEIGAEIGGDEQVECLRFGAIVAQPHRLQPLVEHARANIAAQPGTDSGPGGLQAGISLASLSILPSRH